MSAEDLIFLIRHDRSKVNRLRTYLSWKEVRKNVKDSSDGAGGAGADDVVGIEDAAGGDGKGGGGPGAEGTGPGGAGGKNAAGVLPGSKARRMRVKLSWELLNAFVDAMVANDDDDDGDDDEDAYLDSMQRLRDADRITLAMTREEYEHYSECRAASFTYRKAKRFREWANMSSYIDMKPNDDIIDILGFLTFEMVTTLTETALKVKAEEDEKQRLVKEASKNNNRPNKGDATTSVGGPGGPGTGAGAGAGAGAGTGAGAGAGAGTGAGAGVGAGAGAGGTGDNSDTTGDDMDIDDELPGLFSPPPSEQTPLQPRHIREAFRRLQRAPLPIKNYNGGLARTKVSLI
ncbi:Transcription initiation protein spt3 [Actinomortierella ambigua]|uniref:Transcription initiation protein spt3 n=1 Tax=Actinomortierella ambigua TaxID=1343610 RepID=A0A9P6PPU8_9FUNG|nr:Transcription initiation protein spt3 [Actinomortierella ambigua]